MRTYSITLIGAFFLLLIIFQIPARAGQVVTDEERRWAKGALEQEQSIQPAPNTLAVLYFHNRSGAQQLDPLQKGFAYLLMTDLASVENLRLVERAKLQALVEELNLGTSGLVEKQTAPRVGKLLGASYLVGGEIREPAPQNIGIDADLLKVSDRNTLGRPVAEGKLDQVFELEKKILFELIDILKISLTPEQKAQLKKPLSQNYKALIWLSAGLEASDRGNYTGAAGCYQQALALDPRFLPAQNALNELKGLGLVTVNPRSQALLKTLAEENSSTLGLGNTIATFRLDKPITSGQVRITW